LDCSNERVHAQTIALALDAAGSVVGNRCLELGCGRGQLSCCLAALGADHLVAVDLIPAMIQENKVRHPQIQRMCSDISDQDSINQLGLFDRIFAVEVLQCVPFESTIQPFFEKLLSGGRLIRVVPNGECPIVARTVERFDGNYVPVVSAQIKTLFESCPKIEWWSCRGLGFAEDQRIAPCDPTAWTVDLCWHKPPNRLMFVATKAHRR